MTKMPSTYPFDGVKGGNAKPHYGSHAPSMTCSGLVGAGRKVSSAKPLSASGKPYEAPGAPKGYTSNHHLPLLTPTPHDQKRDY